MTVTTNSTCYLYLGTGLLCLFFYLLCYAAVLKFLTYYAQYYAHVKELCLKSDCSIRVYSLVSKIFNMVSVLLEYIKFIISIW